MGWRIRLAIVLGVLAVAGGFLADRYPGLRADPVGTVLSSMSGTSGQPVDDASVDHQAVREVTDLLTEVQVVDRSPSQPGYERSCDRGDGCVFGTPWTDDTTARLSHDGCQTRDNILREQLDAVSMKPGSDCKVAAGTLNPDPYTGRVIDLDHHGSVSTISIDHVFALERAWDLGANQWSLDQRAQFANDPANLLAVDSSTNSSKGSQGLDWLPPHQSYRCTYIAQYLTVATDYQLPITTDDRRIASQLCT